MGYEDFVWFVLSEEDKTSDSSLEYWFRCVDLDGDGKLSSSELLVRWRGCWFFGGCRVVGSDARVWMGTASSLPRSCW